MRYLVSKPLKLVKNLWDRIKFQNVGGGIIEDCEQNNNLNTVHC